MNVKMNIDEVKNLVIGYSGENSVESVTFDYSAWKTAYGDGVLSLHIKRPMDETAYPVVLSFDGTQATWTISATDTAQTGHGEGQWVYTVGNAVKMSKVFGLNIIRSLEVGEAPDGWTEWLTVLEGLAQTTIENAQTASDKATEASVSEENAEQSATDSAESAEDSEAWAIGKRGGADVDTSDETYNNNSKYYAEQSADSAQNANASETHVATMESNVETKVTEFDGTVEQALSDVDDAKDDAVTAVTNARNTAIASVDSSKENALNTIDTATLNATSSLESIKQSAVSQMSDLVDSAERYSDSAEDSATSANTSATNASESASSASQSATDASESATSAAESATQAEEAAASFVTDPTLSITGKAADAKATGDEISSIKDDLGELTTINTYLEYINPSENLIDYSDLTDGYINAQGHITSPGAQTREKTSAKMPIDLYHTYKFTSSVSGSGKTAWMSVGLWDENDIFWGRYTVPTSAVDTGSIANAEIRPIDMFGNAKYATYMRISYRSYGDVKNTHAYDISMEGKTITDKINEIVNPENAYKVNGGSIDISKQSYDVVQLGFAPLEGSGKTVQGMAIANGTIFQGYGNGTIDLLNLSDGTLITNLAIDGGHCGSLSCSNVYPDGNTEYPELYVSSFNENKTFKYSVTNSSFELLTTYLIPTETAGYCQETCINKADNTLWCVGHKENSYQAGGGLIVSQWDLSNAVNNGNGTETPTLLCKYELQWLQWLQAVQILNGQLFMVTGNDENSTSASLTRIWVSDLGVSSIKAIIENFTDGIKSAEPEGIDFVFNENAGKYYALLSTRFQPHFYKIIF